MATSVTQFGITWTFDGDYPTGQYANGDTYVVGQVSITDIFPYTVDSGGTRWINGSMINPAVSATTGLDEGNATRLNYNHSFNVAVGVSGGNPLVLNPNESLVSAISDPVGYPDNSFIDTMAILTCVSSAPPSNSFRPPYCGTDKTSEWNESDIDYTHLLNLTAPASAPTLTETAGFVARPWVDFYADWHYEWHLPENNMPAYGFYIANVGSYVSCALNLNATNSAKRDTVVGLVQVGIDLFGVYTESIIADTFFWRSDGGNYQGRKFPILFAGTMLNDTGSGGMKRVWVDGDQVEWATDNNVFHEDGQSFYVTQADIDITQGGSWDPDTRNPNTARYSQAMLGMPEWAIRRNRSPERSDSDWNAYYRPLNAPAWHGNCLVTLMLKDKNYWNRDAYFDYCERYMAIANGDVDPFGYTVTSEASGSRSISQFTEDMWDLYYSTYKNSEQDAVDSSTIYIMFTV